jgi:pimeloyl-ACP methyl ester carboxylesterase
MTIGRHTSGWYALRALLAAALALLLGAALIYLRYRQDNGFHAERAAHGSRLAETACGVIEYGDAGEGQPVLVIHGAGGGYDQGLLAGEVLGDGFRVIAPSRFGYLNAPVPERHTVADQADAYVCLLDELKLDRVAVMAVSAGGTSALQFALRHPERVQALVMVSAISNVRPVREADESMQAVVLTDFMYWLAATYLPYDALAFFGLSKEAQAQLSAAELERAVHTLHMMMPLGRRQAGISYDSNERNLFDGADFPLENITAPTLVVHATDDTFVPVKHGEYTAAHIPGARLLTYDIGGHFVFARDAAAAEIRAFLMPFSA